MDEIARTEKEEEVVLEFTTKKCGTECKHCEHNKECNNEKSFRARYCGAWRGKMKNL